MSEISSGAAYFPRIDFQSKELNPQSPDFLLNGSAGQLLSHTEKHIFRLLNRNLTLQPVLQTELDHRTKNYREEVAYTFKDTALQKEWQDLTNKFDKLEDLFSFFTLNNALPKENILVDIGKSVLSGKSLLRVMDGKGTCLDTAYAVVIACAIFPYKLDAHKPFIVPFNLASLGTGKPTYTSLMHDHFGIVFQREGKEYGLHNGGILFNIDPVLSLKNVNIDREAKASMIALNKAYIHSQTSSTHTMIK